MSIQETLLKIKRVGNLPRIVLESLILGIILSTAFFLGRISVKEIIISSSIPDTQNQSAMTLNIPNSKTTNPSLTLPQGKGTEPRAQNFVASKTGKVYYPSSCKALNRIKPANRIYFATATDAQTHHLTLSKSCK